MCPGVITAQAGYDCIKDLWVWSEMQKSLHFQPKRSKCIQTAISWLLASLYPASHTVYVFSIFLALFQNCVLSTADQEASWNVVKPAILMLLSRLKHSHFSDQYRCLILLFCLQPTQSWQYLWVSKHVSQKASNTHCTLMAFIYWSGDPRIKNQSKVEKNIVKRS